MRTPRLLAVTACALIVGACASTPPPAPSYEPPPRYDPAPPRYDPAPPRYDPAPPRYDPAPPRASTSLHDRVHHALRNEMGIAASAITIRVDGSRVFLGGHVDTRSDHERAHDIAHDVSGVSSVDHAALRVH